MVYEMNIPACIFVSFRDRLDLQAPKWRRNIPTLIINDAGIIPFWWSNSMVVAIFDLFGFFPLNGFLFQVTRKPIHELLDLGPFLILPRRG
jgi:hypothetical protein